MCAIPRAVPSIIFILVFQSNGVFSATPLIPVHQHFSEKYYPMDCDSSLVLSTLMLILNSDIC
jgi:hypothetical protein